MSEDNFQWTDSLVKEYLRLITSVEGNDYWQQEINKFKASKTPIKDYEILLCEPDEVITTYPPQFKKGKILSVKRLSDGLVFSIGDKIQGFGNTPVITISKFEIDYFDNTKISAYHVNGYGKGISAWKKVKEPLFLTEDNVPVYEGDRYYVVIEKEGFGYEPYSVAWCGQGSIEDANYKNAAKFFADKEKANDYILLNKPCLSVQDFKDKLGNMATDRYLLEELKELAKQKLSQ